jgi:hypothetical protein
MAVPRKEQPPAVGAADDRAGESATEPRAGRGPNRPWGPYLLLLGVGVGLLWLGWRAELGRLRGWTIGAGATVVVAVAAIVANRVRRRAGAQGRR